MEEFLRQLEEEEERIKEDLEQPAAMSLSPEEEQQFQETVNCWICMRLDIDPNNPRVRDHDHITGDFRGAAHSNCNLELRIKPEQQHIPACAVGKKSTCSKLFFEITL